MKVPTESYLQFDTPQRQSFFTKTSSDSEAMILGKGSYGIVYNGLYKSKNVAIKIIPKHDIFKFNSLKRESNILNIQHENILRVLKIVDASDYGAIIMEKFKDGKPLQYILDRSSQISLRHRLRISCDIISALSYCHSNQICHADLKPLNIMVVVDHGIYQCKLFDFGCSFKVNEVQSKVVGTARYCSPEMLQGKCGVTTSIDIFSFGVVMWQLKENEIPYSAIKSNDVVIFQVVRNNLRPDSTLLLLNDIEKSSFKEKIMRNQFCKSDLFETKLSPKLNTPTKAPLSKSASRKLPKTELSTKKRDKILEIHRDTKKRSRKNLFLENFMSIDINDDEYGAETPKYFKNFFADSSPCDKHFKLFDIENNYINLYKACWNQDPFLRPSTEEVFKLIQQFISLIEH